MALNTLPLIASSFGGMFQTYANADGTTNKQITTTNATKTTRVENLAINWCNDTIDHVAYLYFYDGTVGRFLCTINIPANTGTSTTGAVALNLLNLTALSSFVQTDDLGNKYIDLPPNTSLYLQLAVAMVGSYTMYVYSKTAIVETGIRPMFPIGFTGKVTSFPIGAGTSILDITNTETTPIRIDSIAVFSSETTDRALRILIHNVSSYPYVATINIPANSGNTNALPNVDILRHSAMAPFVQTDAAGNKFIDLPAGWKIQAQLQLATTGSYYVQTIVRWAQYGTGGALNYDSLQTYTAGGIGQGWAAADTTTTKAITTVNANGPIIIDNINVSLSDSTTRDFKLWVHDGSNFFVMGIINIPASAGTTTSIYPVNLMAHANITAYVNVDSAGNKYIELPPNWYIGAHPTTTVATGTLTTSARWRNYGY